MDAVAKSRTVREAWRKVIMRKLYSEVVDDGTGRLSYRHGATGCCSI